MWFKMQNKIIINKAKDIILKYAKPKRIYLFGSYIRNENTRASDIDIAYYDEKYHNNNIIQSEVDQIDTLIKIDVKNIAFVEKRFKERVFATGKSIYSNSKELRFEDSHINFSKAVERFTQVLSEKADIDKSDFSEYYSDIAIKRFEFTYEMAWKTLKRYIAYIGLDCKNPRSCFKEAFAQGLIENENIWLEMIEARNTSSHIYDEYEIQEIVEKMCIFADEFVELKIKLAEQINE